MATAVRNTHYCSAYWHGVRTVLVLTGGRK
jgi:hypothetical protein